MRSEPRGQVWRIYKGGCERQNGWQLAEGMEEAAPYRVQHLLDPSRWDADAARDKLRNYVVEELISPDTVLIVDEKDFLKKGLHSAGVKRQYSGTAGRLENSHFGLFLCYGSDQGAALCTANSTFHRRHDSRTREDHGGIADLEECAKH